MDNAVTLSDSNCRELVLEGFVFDDDIPQLNEYFGDLTATYWIWKNSTYDFVGTSQYQRFWDDSISTLSFEKNTLYVQEPRVLDDP